MGSKVRVLSPAKLAQTVEQRLADALGQYRADGEGIDVPLIDELRRALEDIAARLTSDADAIAKLRKPRTAAATPVKPARKRG